MPDPDARPAVRPLLKWAGGKRQLLPHLRRFYPPSFNRYWEPFLGSGAVFLDLYACGLLEGRRATLIDHNADLVGCYRAVRDHPEQIITALVRLAIGHRRRGADHYYDVRDARFNPLRHRLVARHRKIETSYTPHLAAMLLYLNRTGYNGLFRLNSQGAFNVPAGRYRDPKICDAENIRSVAAALAAPGIDLVYGTFADRLGGAEPGDFLYLDPPYAPLSATARFTSYTSRGFGDADQRALQEVIVALARRGCQVLASNSTAPVIAELYDGNRQAKAARLMVHRVPARRAINSRASRRGPVAEYLITNIRPAW